MKKADVMGNPTLMKIYQAKQDRRKARREAQRAGGPTIKGNEGSEVRKVFESVLEGMKKDTEAHLLSHYSKLAEDAKLVDGMDWRKGYYELDKKRGLRWGDGYYPNEDTKFQRDLMNISFGHPQLLKLKSPEEIRKVINYQIMQDLQAMFEGFILKQTEKVNGILKGRKVRVKSRISGSLEGTFAFSLDDGAKFLMKTQIVWKTSPKGKHFWQFPTTFHNAVKANGQTISPASELNLKKEL